MYYRSDQREHMKERVSVEEKGTDQARSKRDRRTTINGGQLLFLEG
jgi:hypothetical protein